MFYPPPLLRTKYFLPEAVPDFTNPISNAMCHSEVGRGYVLFIIIIVVFVVSEFF